MVRPVFISVLLAAGACVSDDSSEREAAVPADTASAPSGQSEWVVTPEGAGPARIGMSMTELLPHLGSGTDTAGIDEYCDYVAIPAAPDSIGFMVVERRLARIDVYSGETATEAGARVGDTEERIETLYPGVRRIPHKYTGGFYLVVLPDAPADTLSRVVFETDGQIVTRYRAGIWPPVEYVEGCS
jgi:hypothetical protein